MPLVGVAAFTNSQADIFLWIFDEGSGMSGLDLENGTVGPLIVAVAPR
jgi:hypothetical protein